MTFGPYTGGRPSNVTTRFSSFDIDLRFLVVFLNCDVVHVIIVLVTLQILEKILEHDLTFIHSPQSGLALDKFLLNAKPFRIAFTALVFLSGMR